jgi:thermostable 8-oxoguanine DNA glycosylase
MNTPTLETIFASMSSDQISAYSDYWESVKPTNTLDIFRRWLFAYTSIHTTWEGNVRGYNAIKDIEKWSDNKENLRQLLIDARCGMHNVRTEYIWNFTSDFMSNTSDFHRSANETWTAFRDRLNARCKGIGITKVSFTLEMCFPNEAEVVCLDTHMMQVYGMKEVRNSGALKKVYENNEQDWINRSQSINTAPYIARCMFWDAKQGHTDSRYWSYVLES